MLAASVGLQLLLSFIFWTEIYITLACWHLELLVFGVLISLPSGMSCVVLVDASPRAVGASGAEELGAGSGLPHGPRLWSRLPPAPPGAVGYLQGGHRDVLEGRALELSLRHVQCTLL